MSLQPTEYKVSCDVHGCDASFPIGTIESLNHRGWQSRLIFDGTPGIYDISQHSKDIVCPSCCKAGHYKTMTKE